ncbi:GNAT family N-acetyltransferase [Mucilaginibacter daejeonensis]|uniref:GNAT family N-acetyltransferase n=1 Tax=Mucilaginibacter daejeonensis TaxID=398049 RepID=UPI001D1717D8|nr:GNAT family N-acetyltransferase [Mucilaginibacter daejeonensis]UEG54551.1 GNAT family N-acetyltransferase [Mucilaginibacter daejeonensis]
MIQNNVSVRKAIQTDVDAIMALIAEVVPVMQQQGNFQWAADYPNAQIFTTDIQHERLWVAVYDEQVVGVIAICEGQEPEYAQITDWDVTEPAIVAHRLAVSPHMQGKGIAAALLHQCEVVAAERNVGLVRLDTNSVNRPMQNLFLKIGYNLGGEILLPKRPGLTFLAFEKRLNLS